MASREVVKEGEYYRYHPTGGINKDKIFPGVMVIEYLYPGITRPFRFPRLVKGSVGGAVRKLQWRLIGLGYTDMDQMPLEIDGKFGERTLAAVNKFKDNNLPGGNKGDMRGVVAKTTWEWLAKLPPTVHLAYFSLNLDDLLGDGGGVSAEGKEGIAGESDAASSPAVGKGAGVGAYTGADTSTQGDIIRRLIRGGALKGLLTTKDSSVAEISKVEAREKEITRLSDEAGAAEGIGAALAREPIYMGNRKNNDVWVALAQARLAELGYRGKRYQPLGIDGDFGESSLFASNNFKFANVSATGALLLEGEKYNISYDTRGAMDYATFLGEETWGALFSSTAKENPFAPNLGVRDEAGLGRALDELRRKIDELIRGGNQDDAEPFIAEANTIIFNSKSGVYPVSGQTLNQYNYHQVRYLSDRERDKYRFHNGQDMAGEEGQSLVLSTYYGVVSSVGLIKENDIKTGPGNHAVLSVPVKGKLYEFIYMHMDFNSIKVEKDQLVGPGDEIGKVGDTGGSRGAHLHLEVREGNNVVNPYPFIPIDPNT
jgi:peptidoglycan hydrolase-like protein with peptidoglycan-binding domain